MYFFKAKRVFKDNYQIIILQTASLVQHFDTSSDESFIPSPSLTLNKRIGLVRHADRMKQFPLFYNA
jgi:hypothetical protein